MADPTDWPAFVALARLTADRFDPPDLWLAWLVKVEAPGLDDDGFLRRMSRARDTPFYGRDPEHLRQRVDDLETRAWKVEAERQRIRAERTPSKED